MTAIEIKNLSLSYEDRRIIEGLSCAIKKQCITTIIGPNGAGKSTLLKSLARLLKKERGDIFLMDREIAELSQRELAREVAVLLQQNTCPVDITVEKLIYMGRLPHKRWYQYKTLEDDDIVREAMQATGVMELRSKRIFECSGGERQRVWLAMALAQKTGILLLDEPTTYLDISFQIDILELVKRINQNMKITVIMVLHDLNHAFQYSDRILVMQKGKVIRCGTPGEVADIELLRKVYNIDAELIEHEGKPYMIAKRKWR